MSTSDTEHSEKRPQFDELVTQPVVGHVVVTRPRLLITENDLAPETKGRLSAIGRNDRVLGGYNADIQAIFDSVPALVARRLKSITPKNFRLSEVSLELTLDVALPGFEIGGTVTMTMEPKES